MINWYLILSIRDAWRAWCGVYMCALLLQFIYIYDFSKSYVFDNQKLLLYITDKED